MQSLSALSAISKGGRRKTQITRITRQVFEVRMESSAMRGALTFSLYHCYKIQGPPSGMKKIGIAIAALMLAATSFGQGQINFATKVGTDVDAPVVLQSTGQ